MKRSRTKFVTKRVGDLRIHPEAQRNIVKAKLQNIKDNFNLDAVGTVHAVQYPVDGETQTLVIDGQHRVQALMDLGLGDWELQVLVHLDVTDSAGAARLFLQLNNRAPVSVFDKFKNELIAGYDEAVGISDIAKAAGLRVAATTSMHTLACPSALKTVYRLDQGVTLQRTLRICNMAWGKRSEANEGAVVSGLGLFLEKHNGDVEEKSLIGRLAKYRGGPGGLIGDAKGLRKFERGSLPRCVARLILNEYNKGRRIGALSN